MEGTWSFLRHDSFLSQLSSSKRKNGMHYLTQRPVSSPLSYRCDRHVAMSSSHRKEAIVDVRRQNSLHIYIHMMRPLWQDWGRIGLRRTTIPSSSLNHRISTQCEDKIDFCRLECMIPIPKATQNHLAWKSHSWSAISLKMSVNVQPFALIWCVFIAKSLELYSAILPRTKTNEGSLEASPSGPCMMNSVVSGRLLGHEAMQGGPWWQLEAPKSSMSLQIDTPIEKTEICNSVFSHVHYTCECVENAHSCSNHGVEGVETLRMHGVSHKTNSKPEYASHFSCDGPLGARV